MLWPWVFWRKKGFVVWRELSGRIPPPRPLLLGQSTGNNSGSWGVFWEKWIFFNQDDSQLSDTSQTTVATFHPELMRWLIFSCLQLQTNQPINHCLHLHVAESRIFPYSVEPECSLLCLQYLSFLRIIQFIHIVQPARCNVSQFACFCMMLYMFRQFLRPSSGVKNCTYSVSYLSYQHCYLLLAVQASSR